MASLPAIQTTNSSFLLRTFDEEKQIALFFPYALTFFHASCISLHVVAFPGAFAKEKGRARTSSAS